MKIINQNTEIVGILHIDNGLDYELLDLNPQKRTDLARDFHGEPAFAFYVVDNIVAKTIVIVRTGFTIVPYAFPEERLIGFVVEEKEEEKTELKHIESVVLH